MFANLTHWQWVAVAWLEVIVVYGGYLFYLRWRERQAKHPGGKG